jgi:hypothetical protein
VTPNRSRWFFNAGTIVVIVLLAFSAFSVADQARSVYAATTTSAAQLGSNTFTLPFPLYQFGSLEGAGVNLILGPSRWTSTRVQQEYLPTASAVFPWGGFNYGPSGDNWCASANTTATKISKWIYGSGSGYSPSVESLVIGYKMPFMVQEPLDTYGQCVGWAANAKAQYPSLRTYNSLGQPVSQFSYLRVDSIDFAKQIYSDLVNIYYNYKSVDPGILNFWQGIYVSSIGADGGNYPKPYGLPNWNGGFMYGANSVLRFATSVLCTQYVPTATCSSLAALANRYLSTGSSPLLASSLVKVGTAYSRFTNVEFLLGLTYAAYNFSQRYLGGRPFFVLPSYSVWVPPSQCPAPYNTPYVEGLNLMQKLELGVGGYYENGNAPTTWSVQNDLRVCRTLNPYGNLGFFVASQAASQSAYAYFPKYVLNGMYFYAYCLGSSLVTFGNLRYSPQYPEWHTMTAFGTVLNRMQNLHVNQVSHPKVAANHPSTGVSVVSGNGVTLAWFYTNSTSGDVASLTLSTGCTSCTWIALSAMDWSVAGSGSGSTASLKVRIPARGWNPVYLAVVGSNLHPIYSNLPISGSNASPSSVSFTVAGTTASSGWMVVRSTSLPKSVVSSAFGNLIRYPSLSSLNKTTTGYTPSLKYLDQEGWYYDSAHCLLYLHFGVWTSVLITINS